MNKGGKSISNINKSGIRYTVRPDISNNRENFSSRSEGISGLSASKPSKTISVTAYSMTNK